MPLVEEKDRICSILWGEIKLHHQRKQELQLECNLKLVLVVLKFTKENQLVVQMDQEWEEQVQRNLVAQWVLVLQMLKK